MLASNPEEWDQELQNSLQKTPTTPVPPPPSSPTGIIGKQDMGYGSFEMCC